jgi:hypothetical protein
MMRLVLTPDTNRSRTKVKGPCTIAIESEFSVGALVVIAHMADVISRLNGGERRRNSSASGDANLARGWRNRRCDLSGNPQNAPAMVRAWESNH